MDEGMDTMEHHDLIIRTYPDTIHIEWFYFRDDWVGVTKREGEHMQSKVTVMGEAVPQQH
jgi:hypothetical protein